MYVSIYVSIYTYTYIHISLSTFIYISTYIFIYIHTHTHIYILPAYEYIYIPFARAVLEQMASISSMKRILGALSEARANSRLISSSVAPLSDLKSTVVLHAIH